MLGCFVETYEPMPPHHGPMTFRLGRLPVDDCNFSYCDRVCILTVLSMQEIRLYHSFSGRFIMLAMKTVMTHDLVQETHRHMQKLADDNKALREKVSLWTPSRLVNNFIIL